MNTGDFIQSTPLQVGSIFENVVVFITEYNERGAAGFVVNKPFHRKFNELQEFRSSSPFPLFEGGPVDQEHIFFIHRRPDLIGGGTRVTDNLYMGGDFKQAVTYLNNKTLTGVDVKLFVGYCGWDAGELEAEIKEGCWTMVKQATVF